MCMPVFVYVWLLLCKWWAANIRDEHGLAGWEELLVWAGIKLILFPAQHRGPFCFSPHQWGDLGIHKDWEETQPGQQLQLTPGNLCVIVLTVWSSGKRKEGGTFWVKAFVFPSDCHSWWSPAVLRVAKHLPAYGNDEWIPCSALLECMGFALPFKLSLSHTTYSLLLFWFSPPSDRDSEPGAVWGWVAARVKPWLRASQMMAGQGRTT